MDFFLFPSSLPHFPPHRQPRCWVPRSIGTSPLSSIASFHCKSLYNGTITLCAHHKTSFPGISTQDVIMKGISQPRCLRFRSQPGSWHLRSAFVCTFPKHPLQGLGVLIHLKLSFAHLVCFPDTKSKCLMLYFFFPLHVQIKTSQIVLRPPKNGTGSNKLDISSKEKGLLEGKGWLARLPTQPAVGVLFRSSSFHPSWKHFVGLT